MRYSNWVKATKSIHEYPIGTKYKAIGGGYWTKTQRGFEWSGGATFPSIGGDWNGSVMLPSHFECMDCGWSGDVSETNADFYDDEFYGTVRKIPCCPECGGGSCD